MVNGEIICCTWSLSLSVWLACTPRALGTGYDCQVLPSPDARAAACTVLWQHSGAHADYPLASTDCLACL